jgi:hypothetical protein
MLAEVVGEGQSVCYHIFLSWSVPDDCGDSVPDD